MLYRIHINFLDVFHRPVFQKTRRFGNWICFRPQVNVGAQLSRYLLPHLHLRTETDPVSEASCFFFGIQDDGKSPQKFCEFCTTRLYHHSALRFICHFASSDQNTLFLYSLSKITVINLHIFFNLSPCVKEPIMSGAIIVFCCISSRCRHVDIVQDTMQRKNNIYTGYLTENYP
jgi:hypothetical protein